MGQTTNFDSSHAWAQIKYAIKSLHDFAEVDNEDDVIYTSNRLNAVLRMIDDRRDAWNQDAIRELVLRQHDPLKNINVKSQAFIHRVRAIQQEMIARCSWHCEGYDHQRVRSCHSATL